jgi:hypothetical protein
MKPLGCHITTKQTNGQEYELRMALKTGWVCWALLLYPIGLLGGHVTTQWFAYPCSYILLVYLVVM